MSRFAALFTSRNPSPRQQRHARRSMKTARQARRRRGRLECLERRSMLAAGSVDTSYGNAGVALAAFGTNDATALASALLRRLETVARR